VGRWLTAALACETQIIHENLNTDSVSGGGSSSSSSSSSSEKDNQLNTIEQILWDV
jgi:hypothetical protein